MTPSFPERFNMADYFLYHNLEEGRENKVCLYFEDRSGRTVRWRVYRIARETRCASWVRIEDRVLMVLPDCPEFVWTWFGAARIGAVITMVNPLLPAADYEYYLDYTRARVAVVHESVMPAFAEAAQSARYLRGVLVVGQVKEFQADRARWVSFAEAMDARRRRMHAGGYAPG